jgi:hypothetical protein
MRYARHADNRAVGRVFEVDGFTQRLVDLDGGGGEDAGCPFSILLRKAGVEVDVGLA